VVVVEGCVRRAKHRPPTGARAAAGALRTG
jgi:hypothetical protein